MPVEKMELSLSGTTSAPSPDGTFSSLNSFRSFRKSETNVVHRLWDEEDEDMDTSTRATTARRFAEASFSNMGGYAVPLVAPRTFTDVVHVALTVPEANRRLKGFVLFCPSMERGKDAAFVALSRMLFQHDIGFARVSRSQTGADLLSFVKAVLVSTVCLLSRITSGKAYSRNRSSQRRPFRICLVGQSVGGAVALAAASGLTRLLNVRSEAGDRVQARLAGVCTLGAACSTPFDQAGLGGVQKLLLHNCHDTRVALAVSNLLYESMCPPKELVEIQSNTDGHQGCKDAIVDLIRGFVLDAILGSNGGGLWSTEAVTRASPCISRHAIADF